MHGKKNGNAHREMCKPQIARGAQAPSEIPKLHGVFVDSKAKCRKLHDLFVNGGYPLTRSASGSGLAHISGESTRGPLWEYVRVDAVGRKERGGGEERKGEGRRGKETGREDKTGKKREEGGRLENSRCVSNVKSRHS